MTVFVLDKLPNFNTHLARTLVNNLVEDGSFLLMDWSQYEKPSQNEERQVLRNQSPIH